LYNVFMNETVVREVARIGGGNKSVPFYNSSPSAGFPSPGDDSVDQILDIHDLLLKTPASTFFVRVAGDSMEGRGIFSGDVLVIDRSIEVKNGQIVVAAVYGEMVVKELCVRDGRCYLLSANESYEPILVNDKDDCYIWGVVVGSVRQFES